MAMLSYTMRSRLAGLASRPILHYHTFSTTPAVCSNNYIKDAFEGLIKPSPTPAIVTHGGLDKIKKHNVKNNRKAIRAEASFKAKDAHNWGLFFTPDLLDMLPTYEENKTWKEQAVAVLQIIEYEQSLALVCRGITVS
jgi:hypothetical protein